MTDLVQRSVDFYGDGLVVFHQDGISYTPVKPVCDRFGIDWEGQRQRIARDEVLDSATCMIKAQIPGDTQRRDHVCLPLDYLNGWLFGVDVGRIRPELRERLILYKRECYRILARAFQGGEGVASASLEARVAALEAAQRGAQQRILRIKTASFSPMAESIIAVLQAHPDGGPLCSREIIAALQDRGHEAPDRLTWLKLRRMAAGGVIVRCGRSLYRLD